MKRSWLGLLVAGLLPAAVAAPSAPCAGDEGRQELKRFQRDVAERVEASPAGADPRLALYAAYVAPDARARDSAFRQAAEKSPTDAAGFHRALYLAGQFQDGPVPDLEAGLAALRRLAADGKAANADAAALWLEILKPDAPDAEAIRTRLRTSVLQAQSIDLSTDSFVDAEWHSRYALGAPADSYAIGELSTYSSIYSKWYSTSIREIATLFNCGSRLASTQLQLLRPFAEDRLPPYEAQWARWANATLRVAIFRRMSKCDDSYKSAQDSAERQLTQRRLELNSLGPFVDNSQRCDTTAPVGSVLLVNLYNFWYRIIHPSEFDAPDNHPPVIG